MEEGRREVTGKLAGESGSRRSMFMVRQFVTAMLGGGGGWWRMEVVGDGDGWGGRGGGGEG